MINYDDFAKIELRTATILVSESVENSEKLLKLKVDLGDNVRQIIAGIARKYSSESLVGRQIVVVANLEPRQLMGYESDGMVLAADSPDGPVLLTPLEPTPNGTRIK